MKAISKQDAAYQKKKRKKSLRAWFEDTGITYAMLAPNFILFALFVIYPLLWTMRFMFFEYNGISAAEFIGLDNFKRAIGDQLWWNSVLNTFKVTFLKLLIEMPLALVLAVILNQNLKGRGFFRGAFFLPTVTSMATISLVFSFMFSPYNGIVNMLLKSWGIIQQNISFLESPTSALVTCVIVSVWSVFGQNMLLILAGLQNIPQDVYESAALDGANSVQTFFKITVPMIMPMFRIIMMLAIIGSLGIFESIFVLTGGGPSRATEVMAINIYNHYFSSSTVPEYGYGAALSFISSIIIGLVTLVYLKLQKQDA